MNKILCAIILFAAISAAGCVRQPSRCGIENCHGLDITCGPNVPDACTDIYMAGDRCRGYADCTVIDGKCQLVRQPAFDVCRTCVEACGKSGDTISVMECEARCGTPAENPNGTAGDGATSPGSAGADFCVDYLGKTVEKPCGTDRSDRECSSDEDCRATCNFGCVNSGWAGKGINDCTAIPEYECYCTGSLCTPNA